MPHTCQFGDPRREAGDWIFPARLPPEPFRIEHRPCPCGYEVTVVAICLPNPNQHQGGLPVAGHNQLNNNVANRPPSPRYSFLDNYVHDPVEEDRLWEEYFQGSENPPNYDDYDSDDFLENEHAGNPAEPREERRVNHHSNNCDQSDECER